MADRRYEDDRARRRDRSGFGMGAATGVVVGAGVGLILPGVAVITGGLVGVAIGCIAGRWLARQVSVYELDPNVTNRPYVGAQSPDADMVA
jgi:hypothetical protein